MKGSSPRTICLQMANHAKQRHLRTLWLNEGYEEKSPHAAGMVIGEWMFHGSMTAQRTLKKGAQSGKWVRRCGRVSLFWCEWSAKRLAGNPGPSFGCLAFFSLRCFFRTLDNWAMMMVMMMMMLEEGGTVYCNYKCILFLGLNGENII